MDLVITETVPKNKKPTVCLNMIVKNESQVILKTLANLCSYIDFDYWVISDTGSTDNTPQLIRDYFLEKGIPGELFLHEWRDFGYNRTKALECAYDKTDYLLIFDADDKLVGDFKLPFAKACADRYMLKIGKGFEYVRPLLINNRKRWEFKGVLHEFLNNIEPVSEDATVGGDYHIESGRTGSRNLNPTKYYDDAIVLEKAYQNELALPDKGLSGRYAFYCARSYKDAGEKYHDKAVEWYTTVLDIPHHWAQEKYYAALEIGLIYKGKTQMELAIPFLLKTLEYDMERIEGLIVAIEYFYQTGQYILINALYHKFKNYNRCLQNKLFITMPLYEDRLEFFNAISAHYIHDYLSGYKCCAQVLRNQQMGLNELLVVIQNLLHYRAIIEQEKDTLPLFRTVDNLLYKHNELVNQPAVVEVWTLLFNRNRSILTAVNKIGGWPPTTPTSADAVKSGGMGGVGVQPPSGAMHALSLGGVGVQPPNGVMPALSLGGVGVQPPSGGMWVQPPSGGMGGVGGHPPILLTFTTCKRLDLFKETVHSILNHWTDLNLVTHWFCVDDNSSPEDRQQMTASYPWIEYYLKTPAEKGHRQSMNIIWHKLQTLKPMYWIHMEDDFLFYHPMDYIKQAIQVLSQNTDGIKQVVFNRNYAETIAHYNSKGHLPTKMPNIVLHDHRPHESITQYMNTHYWPHYSFRPAMTLVSAVLALGNYDSPNQFFERDYADKWHAAGHKTAFFDRITHRHIGRLTSEIASGTVKNAYELNAEAQFQAPVSNIKVINLERRPDRKLAITHLLNAAQLSHFVFYKAVDGKTLESTDALKKLFQGNDFGNRRGFMGCALSHQRLWQALVADKNHDYYVILEDDISFTAAGFKERFDQLKPAMAQEEVLFLGYHMFQQKREAVKHIYDALTSETALKVEPLNKELYIGGFFAYSINKVGAQKLLAYIEENGIKHGIDYLIKIMPNLKVSELQPLLIRSEWYEDKSKPFDTDIQACPESLDFTKTLEDHFEFVPQLDQIGHDLYFHKDTVTECMRKALKDRNCLGFNTLGFFKNKIETLSASHYFKEGDGLYVKKGHVPACAASPVPAAKHIRLKMLCHWCSSEQLCQEWSNMYLDQESWKHIKMTWTNDPREIDYYVIINSPHRDEVYEPSRTIVFQMEPWVADPHKNWGVKTWGEWATPDPTKFFKVFTHKTHLNNVQWQIAYPFYSKAILADSRQSLADAKQNKVAVVCSPKNFDEGHILRNNLIKYVDSTTTLIDIWGRVNYHQFQNYKGAVPADNKYNVYANYKYCLAVENNSEHNYATEKIWEGILCESLCFYWGCPNLEDYIDSRAFVRLPLEDPATALKIIQQAIVEDWWAQRIWIIKQMKEKILNELGFFPLLVSILRK